MSIPTKSVTPDRSKIAMDHPDEVKYWTRHLGVTAEELSSAVERVGNSARAVRKEIEKLEDWITSSGFIGVTQVAFVDGPPSLAVLMLIANPNLVRHIK